MKNRIAYCGMDCEKCDAYLATIHDDQALREKTAKLCAELNNAPILPEHINCQGCRMDGVKTVFCDSFCFIRQCALQKGVTTCGGCPELNICPTVGAVISNNAEALENLKAKGTKMAISKNLFSGWDETIVWSCLQGVMGRICVNDAKKPTAAIALLGDFGFLAGQVDAEFLRALKRTVCRRDFLILIPQNEAWNGVIEACYGENCRSVTRYAFKKETEGLDRSKLQQLVNGLPKEYRLTMIDQRWYSWCRRTNWCKDLVSQYESYEQYVKLGLGVLILKDDIPVSGASAYSAYRSGIEVEIDTREDHRRKGLATVCGAKLILECLKRGLYPSWDAQNPWSAALAEKLGYRFSHEYTAYETFLQA